MKSKKKRPVRKPNPEALDALMEEDGTLLIEAGHFGQEASRPLDLEMANWLLNTPIEDM